MSITKIQPRPSRPLNSGRGNGKSIEFPSPQRHLLADIAFLVYVLSEHQNVSITMEAY